MTPKGVSRAALALLMALPMSGCIAAAIPAVAGAALVRTGGGDETSDDGTASVTESEAEGLTQAAAENTAKPASTAVASADIPVAPPAPLPDNVILGPAPAPTPEPAQSSPGDASYAKLFEFALSPVRPDARNSAMLRDPSALDGKLKKCRSPNPVVLIDLDPQEGRLQPDDAPLASTSMASGLQSLRDRDIDIAWISASTAAEAGAIREALTRTGLDPEREDRLILMRYPGDRKQTRRQELAREGCVIAIAGDHRSDFDELFEYLVNPEAALGLELLIGEGWFLVPPALTENKTSDAKNRSEGTGIAAPTR